MHESLQDLGGNPECAGRRSTEIVVESMPGFGCGWSLKGSHNVAMGNAHR